MEKDPGFKIEGNVSIKILSAKGELIRSSVVHNHATQRMLEGLIKFLRGHFNPSNVNETVTTSSINSAKSYLPVYIGFGYQGLEDASMVGNEPLYNYSATSLEEESGPRIKFTRVDNYNDTEDLYSQGLRLQAIISPGILTSSSYHNVYEEDSKVKVAFSELGLFASSNGNDLLARTLYTNSEEGQQDSIIVIDNTQGIRIDWVIKVSALGY